MANLLFSLTGRITRGQFWMAALLYVVAAGLVGAGMFVLWQVIPGQHAEDGSFNVSGFKALPYILLAVGYLVFSVWSGICVNAKRMHDRDKSGWWMLIQLVPIIGGIWYVIEAGFLRGTPGPNRFGPDPSPGTV